MGEAYLIFCESPQFKKVTIDTNVLPADDLVELAKSRGWDVVIASVTERELGHGDTRLQVPGLGKVLEVAVLGESVLGSCVLAGDDNYLETLIQIISNGSFPKSGTRGQLSDGRRRQLRDAMIIEAHARERRDIFVTNDRKGFIDDGRREKLQTLLKTRIVTSEEFLEELRN